jgi:predicted phage terminase large subunit-like protein
MRERNKMAAWDKLGDETAVEYMCFCQYRDLGLDRTLLKAWQLSARSFNFEYWNNLYWRFGWQKRAESYDQFMIEFFFKQRFKEKFNAAKKLSLKKFVQEAWPIVEPGVPYQGNWHIDVICDHLEAVSKREIRNLIINIPPRHGKSTLVSVMWPCWEWGEVNPSSKWLFSSYAQSLSNLFSIKCRRLIQSDWYQTRYEVRICSDQNEKLTFENTNAGCRVATSVGGAATGKGGDYIVVDDPIKAGDAESDTMRNAVIDWWSQEMSTRGNDPSTVAKVIIMQRLHENDLAGYLLENEKFEHLCLATEYDPARHCSTSIWSDHRKESGELLWGDRYTREVIEKLKKELGSYGYAAQQQQNPVPAGGGMIKTSWFNFYENLPESFEKITQSWDTASKGNELTNCPWVCTTWGEINGEYYLINVFRKFLEYPEGLRAIQILAQKYNPDAILIEDKGTGTTAIQDLRRKEILKFPIIPVRPTADKLVRLAAQSPVIEAGLVHLPKLEENWLTEYLNEITKFPKSQYADQVDSTSQFLEWAKRSGRSVAFDFLVG